MTSLDDSIDVGFQDQRMLDSACDDVLGLQPLVGGPASSPEDFFVGEIDVNEASRPHLGASQSSNALLLENLDDDDSRLLASPSQNDPDPSELLLGTSAPASLHNSNWSAFPSIPEHAELQMIQQPSSALAHPTPAAIPGQPILQPTFIPTAATTGLETYQYNNSNEYGDGTGLSVSPSSSGEGDFDGGALHHHLPFALGGSTFTMGQVGGGRGGVPKVASMPNLQLAGTSLGGNGGSNTNLHALAVRRAAVAAAIAGEGPVPVSLNAAAPSTTTTNIRTSTRMPRSRSANDVSGLGRYAAIPHSGFLTPPHLRKGKGGRQPAGDPRMDPRIDPKKAKRILANRLSAAKSKLKQKSAAEGLKQRVEMLRLQREGLATEVSTLADACAEKEAEREALLRQLRAAEEALMHGKIPLSSGGNGNNGMNQSHMAGLMV
jgi:Basic region leucine zipper